MTTNSAERAEERRPEVEDDNWARDFAVVRRWVHAGFNHKTAIVWRSLFGDVDPERLRPWRETGLPPEQCVEWARRGLEPDEALEWHDLGCGVKDAGKFGSLDALHRWMELGFSMKRALRWLAIPEVARPGVASEWRSLGCGPKDAARWLEVPGVDEAADAAAWLALGISPEDAAMWLKVHGIDGPAQVWPWVDRGMTAEEASAWEQILPAGLPGAGPWREAGIRPDEAARWIEMGSVHTAERALEWRAAGFGPKLVGCWERAFGRGLVQVPVTPALVTEWRFASCSPKTAARCVLEGLSAVDVMQLAEYGIGPNDAPAFSSRVRRSPRKGLHKPDHIYELSPTDACLAGDHDHCRFRRSCSCTCHCWHDLRRFDVEQQGEGVGGHPPRLLLMSRRSMACRSFLPGRHERCRLGGRCACSCHCWHRTLQPTSEPQEFVPAAEGSLPRERKLRRLLRRGTSPEQ